jgi:hypothetical protein
MDGHIVHFDMIGGLAVGFFGFPGDEVIGLGESLGAGFMIVVHGITPWLNGFAEKVTVGIRLVF